MTDHIPLKKTFIFIDGSYFCFHRYYSIVRWWKNAHPEEADVLLNPYENTLFHDKFVKTFVETVKDIPKNLGFKKDNHNFKMIVGKDCRRENIWRNEHQEKYKANRKNESGCGPFFKKVYDDGLFTQGGASTIMLHDKLEADDCIAISTRYLLKKYKDDPTLQIYIITSDKDYLQLIGPNVKLFDLTYKNLAEQKSSFGDARANLFCKIIMGDISDNIPSIFKKCGPKTTLKCYQNPHYFQEKLKNENAYDKFKNNKIMVDFECIPAVYTEELLICYNADLTSW